MLKLVASTWLIFGSLLSFGQQKAVPQVLDFAGFEHYLHQENDSLYVLNFWATWCKPCIEEMPLFEALNKKYKTHPFKVILVSLDFEHQIQTKLIPYLKEKNLRSQVIVLSAPNANAWIDKVDPSWSGAIPATLFYKNKHRSFHEKQFEEFSDLESIIQSILNKSQL